MEMFKIRESEDLKRFLGRRFCSRACSDARAERDLEGKREFFMDRVLPEPNSGCWLWTGALAKGGYAKFSSGADKRRAARVSYSLFCDEIGEGLLIRHRCDTPLCVNPDHLVPGTVKDNSADAIARGQHIRGEAHKNAKLNSEQVAAILFDPRKQNVLAREYGVSRATICMIKAGKRWGHAQ
jgi:hypothetical protein